MIYKVDRLSNNYDKIFPLVRKAWDEVDQRSEHMKLDPDIDTYTELEDNGMIRLYLVYLDETEQDLVGFLIAIIQPVLHSKSKFQATTDVVYVDPNHRGVGAKLISLAENDLREEGVHWFSFAMKEEWSSHSKLAEKLGFKLNERIYQKVL